MSGKKNLGALDFDVMVGDRLLHVEKMTASISDNRQHVKTRGVPDGYVDGDVECKGDLELDTNNFNLLVEVAKGAGSWRDMPAVNIIYVGKTTAAQHRVELFGCVLNVSDLLDNDAKGGSKTTHKIPFEVTSSDFVRINGVPYLAAKDTRDLFA
jgi:hypothetical protein